MKKVMKVPSSAMVFTEEADIQLSESDAGKPVFSMTAYSGKIIKNHSYWGDLAIDVSGISFNQKRIPILEEHDSSRKLGVSNTPPKIDATEGVVFEKINLLSNAHAMEFKQNLDDDFPYQASISIRPQMVEELAEGATAEVNGYKMKGPARIIRKSIFREASACLFGADHRTSVQSLSEEDCDVDVLLTETHKQPIKKKENGGKPMKLDLAAIKETHPEVHAQLEAALKEKDTVNASLSTECVTLNAEIERLKKQNTDLTSQNAQNEVRLSNVEKAEQLRKEKEVKSFASGIVSAKLLESKLPGRLFARIQKSIDFNAFVGEDTVLDVTKFTEHVEAEINSWKTDLTDAESNAVILGLSAHSQEGENQNEDLADKLVAMVS